jgi:protein-S-isoprenylcysteine O-methyltransferase Ste14
MQVSRYVVLAVLIVGLTANTLARPEGAMHEFMEMSGYLLVAICALGRVYASAFIGGIKNTSLVMAGPYSLCRNPLYTLSWIGFVGIALMSTSVTATVVTAIIFGLLYRVLVLREEEHMRATFGEAFNRYCLTTPQFVPALRPMDIPDALTIKPRYLGFAVLDALAWFIPLPLFEVIDYMQTQGGWELPFYIP